MTTKWLRFSFYDPGHQDLTFEVDISALTPDPDWPLKHLFDGCEIFLVALNTPCENVDGEMNTLHKGKREIGGMQAKEGLVRFDWWEGDKERHGILFAAETYRDKPALSRPTLSLQVEAVGAYSWRGQEEYAKTKMVGYWWLPDFAGDVPTEVIPPPPIKPSLTEYEAQAVWEAILPSIRLRPSH